jgi:hypothetical protein
MSAVSAPIFSAPVFVTWTQQWDMDRYVEHYVRSRRLTAHEHAREAVREALASYPGRTPYTKSALDFYLDANLGRDN